MFVSERRNGLFEVLLVGLLASSLGCVEASLMDGRGPMNYAPIERPVPPAPTEGAIWRGGASSGSFLFFDEKARGIGDLVTVLIIEQTQAEGSALTQSDSENKIGTSLSSDVGFQSLIGTPIRNVLRGIGFGDAGRSVAQGSDLNILESGTKSGFQGQGKTSRSGRFTGAITCRVVDVLPGGIFLLEGRRKVIINHEAQLIMLRGLVRREDLGINNTVRSTAIAELQLSYDGLGIIDDSQRPGWMARIFRWTYPF